MEIFEIIRHFFGISGRAELTHQEIMAKFFINKKKKLQKRLQIEKRLQLIKNRAHERHQSLL